MRHSTGPQTSLPQKVSGGKSNDKRRSHRFRETDQPQCHFRILFRYQFEENNFKKGLVHWEDPEGSGREGGGRGDRDGEYM